MQAPPSVEGAESLSQKPSISACSSALPQRQLRPLGTLRQVKLELESYLRGSDSESPMRKLTPHDEAPMQEKLSQTISKFSMTVGGSPIDGRSFACSRACDWRGGHLVRWCRAHATHPSAEWRRSVRHTAAARCAGPGRAPWCRPKSPGKHSLSSTLPGVFIVGPVHPRVLEQ